jgi:hypothetical protein
MDDLHSEPQKILTEKAVMGLIDLEATMTTGVNAQASFFYPSGTPVIPPPVEYLSGI